MELTIPGPPPVWPVLGVDVQTNGASPFTPLWPLQALTATPYAIMAGSASILLGTLPIAQLPAALRTNNQIGVVINGAFNGNGAGLTNLNVHLPSLISGTLITVGATNEIAPLTVPPSLPAGPIGSVGTGWAPYGLALAGRYAYVVDYDASTLQVIDVSTTSAPTVLATVSTGSQSNPKSVAVAGRYAYVADYGDSGHNLQVFDVSNPAGPVAVGSVAAGYAEAVGVSGRYAHVTGDGNAVEVFDLSNPAAPLAVGSMPSGSPIPKPPGFPPLPPLVPPGGGGGTAIAVSGRYACVVNSNTGAKTLNIFDGSNPAAPVSVGSAPTASYPSAVAVSGRYAFVMSDSSQGVNTLQVFDVSNPAAPVRVGSATADGRWAFSLAVAGRYAYVANYNASSLQVFDVSNPSVPVSLGKVATCRYPQGVVVSGRYAYVANYGDNSLQVFDLGGAYVQQLEAGTVETGTLQTRDTVTVGNNLNVRGGLTVSESARISGGLSVENGTITAANLAASSITGANITATSFSGNCAGLVNVPASGLSGGITIIIVIDGHTFYYTNGVLINIQ